MAQTYSKYSVKMFLRRIKEEKERAEAMLVKVRVDPNNYNPSKHGECMAKINICEDLLRIAELHFGPDVKEE